MLAERMESWFEEATNKGVQQGMQQGESLLLQRQLVRRFGMLSAEQIARISAATPSQLETWGDRVLDAKSLDEVFCDATH